MMMYTLSNFTVTNSTMHMGRLYKRSHVYFSCMLGKVPVTYNSVAIPRPVIFDTDYPIVLPVISKIGYIKRGC